MSHAAGRPARGGMGVPIGGSAAARAPCSSRPRSDSTRGVLERLAGPPQPLVRAQPRSRARRRRCAARAARGVRAFGRRRAAVRRPSRPRPAAALGRHRLRELGRARAPLAGPRLAALLDRPHDRLHRAARRRVARGAPERAAAPDRRSQPDARRARSARSYGGLGHGSHQNGLDADIYYPRRDGTERAVCERVADRSRARAGSGRTGSCGAACSTRSSGRTPGLTGPRAW